MLAHYGYSDGSGSYFITIDTDKCYGCGDCVSVCPSAVFEILDEDPNDPLNENPVASVASDKNPKVKYLCAECKPSTNRPKLPCMVACAADAIEHSW